MALRSNDPCWCGSGRKYKRCHKPLEGRVLPGRRQPDARRCRRTSPGRRTPTPATPRRWDEPRVKSPEIIERMRRAGARRRRDPAPRRRDGRARASPPTRSTPTSTSCTSSATPTRSPLNYNGFPKSVCTSVNEVICHGIPDSRALQDGDIVNLDVTAYIGGVHGDTNATFFVGDVDPESRAARAGHRGVHVARHRGRRAGPPDQRHRPGHRGPRQGAPLRRGAGVHRPRHRRAVPHRHPGAALLRLAGSHDHAARA